LNPGKNACVGGEAGTISKMCRRERGKRDMEESSRTVQDRIPENGDLIGKGG
jgi:hypothetical protein